MAPGPGELGPVVEVGEDELQTLVRRALTPSGEGAVVWSTLDDELVLHAEECRVAVREGLVLVGLRVRCDQDDGTELVVPFAVGAPASPAGLVAAGETTARGASALVTGLWGPTAVAAAWSALLLVAEQVAAHVDVDAEGRPLLPGALEARNGVLAVTTQARHAIDRAALA